MDDDQQFLELLAFIYLEHGKYTKAKVLLQLINDLGQAPARVYNALAFCALSMDDEKLATKVLEQAEAHQEITPADLRFSQYLRSQMHLKTGDLENARKTFAQTYATS